MRREGGNPLGCGFGGDTSKHSKWLSGRLERAVRTAGLHSPSLESPARHTSRHVYGLSQREEPPWSGLVHPMGCSPREYIGEKAEYKPRTSICLSAS